MPGRRLLSASTLIGDPLVSATGERIGRIEELLISPSGSICLLAIVPVADLGLGEKLLVVPWEALQFDSQQEQVTLDFDHQRLRDAPVFDPDRWPERGDESWMKGIHEFYGTQPRVW